MIIKNMGSALRFCIPQSIGKKLGEFWELIKPLVDFKYEVVQYLTLYITVILTAQTGRSAAKHTNSNDPFCKIV